MTGDYDEARRCAARRVRAPERWLFSGSMPEENRFLRHTRTPARREFERLPLFLRGVGQQEDAIDNLMGEDLAAARSRGSVVLVGGLQHGVDLCAGQDLDGGRVCCRRRSAAGACRAPRRRALRCRAGPAAPTVFALDLVLVALGPDWRVAEGTLPWKVAIGTSVSRSPGPSRGRAGTAIVGRLPSRPSLKRLHHRRLVLLSSRIS